MYVQVTQKCSALAVPPLAARELSKCVHISDCLSETALYGAVLVLIPLVSFQHSPNFGLSFDRCNWPIQRILSCSLLRKLDLDSAYGKSWLPESPLLAVEIKILHPLMHNDLFFSVVRYSLSCLFSFLFSVLKSRPETPRILVVLFPQQPTVWDYPLRVVVSRCVSISLLGYRKSLLTES
jgi:hypothetical protein